MSFEYDKFVTTCTLINVSSVDKSVQMNTGCIKNTNYFSGYVERKLEVFHHVVNCKLRRL